MRELRTHEPYVRTCQMGIQPHDITHSSLLTPPTVTRDSVTWKMTKKRVFLPNVNALEKVDAFYSLYVVL